MPASDQPEQISAAQPTWDTENQRFELAVESKLAKANDNALGKFTVRATTRITLGEQTFDLEAERSLEVVEMETTDRARLAPIRTSWDRNAGAVSGTVSVAGTVALINPGGQTIDTDDFSAEVDIG